MRLVTVAHGTRHPTGNEVAVEIARRAGERLGIEASAAYVELCEPLFADLLRSSEEMTVAVPLLLSRGFHVAVDLPAAVLAARGETILAPALGPHPLLARAQVARLVEAGAVPGMPVVMVAAGSRDASAAADLARAARLLAEAWGGPVRSAVLSGEGARPDAVIEPDDAVSPYLLAPGHFADRLAASASAARAGVVADVIRAHDLVVDLVVERAAAATHASLSGSR
ncbi:sirohydrochlorin chelatase [Nocardioides sp. AN3]